ncbi:calcium-binding protein [Roseovarius sp. SYSU LYC5161]|uniref:calcium-binding protein n=1 Tax=Roseovarius halophilus (ex Wu et al. 2025) TaxID=3376060 RepID=UPI0039997B04
MSTTTHHFIDVSDESDIPLGYRGGDSQPSNVESMDLSMQEGTRTAHVVADDRLFIYSLSDDGQIDFAGGYPNAFTQVDNIPQGDVATFRFDDMPFLASANNGFEMYSLTPSGELATRALARPDSDLLMIENARLIAHWTNADETDFFAVPSATENGMTVFSLTESPDADFDKDPNAKFSALASGRVDPVFARDVYGFPGASSLLTYEFQDIVHVSVSGRDFLYLSSTQDAAIAAFELAGRTLGQIGLTVADPNVLPEPSGNSVLATLAVGAEDFVVHHAGDQLYIHRIGADGRLETVRDMPWQPVGDRAEIETLTHDGRGFLLLRDEVAADAGGLAVYEVFQDGTMTKVAHLQTPFATRLSMTETYTVDDTLFVLAADALGDSLVTLSVDLAALDPAETLILGGRDDDTLAGGIRSEEFLARAGNDVVAAGPGDDTIAASHGDDTVHGGAGDDRIGGGHGHDVIDGGDGSDTIGAGLGDDDVRGAGGTDFANGGAGRDTMDGGAGADTVGGGLHHDIIAGRTGDDSLGGGPGRDTITGGDGDDRMGGGEGDDRVDGGTGHDFMAGGGRDDVLSGGSGRDTINGGDGDDTMYGGADADVFVYNFFKAGDSDVITDFDPGQDGLMIRTRDPDTGAVILANDGDGIDGYIDALNITASPKGAVMDVAGHRVLLEDIEPAQLSPAEFDFV